MVAKLTETKHLTRCKMIHSTLFCDAHNHVSINALHATLNCNVVPYIIKF